ncbi:MAG: hypothetical protein ACRCTA_00185, partial [Bacilli bacterium]
YNIISDEELINILVQASRSDLDLIKQKWSLLENYLLNVNTKKIASLLIDGSPVAASKEAIIIVGDDYNANDFINNSNNVNEIGYFMKNFNGQFQFCLALNLEQWKKLKNDYLALRQIQKLPQPKPVLANFIINEDVEEQALNPLVSFGQKLFKDKLQIKKEE